ncbi:IS1595 family transposase [Clostridium pasteurianum]|nr:IS1595 family transposase [Clostridium pasteurianum]UZW15384.1 IS1595 family transposase [Clostridium pasteurianum]
MASFGELPSFVDFTYKYFKEITMDDTKILYVLETPKYWTDEWINWETQDRSKEKRENQWITVYGGIVRGRVIGGNLNTILCKGRMKNTDLERLFTSRIKDQAILCTDSHKSYIQFTQNLGVELQQIKLGKHKEGIYHIQHINTFHSKLKKWMDRFNGVATKYLANYMYWFKWLEIFNTEKDTIKSKNLLVQSHTDTKLKDFRIREAIYI